MPQETEAAPGEPTEPTKTEITSAIVAPGQEPVLETRQVPDIRSGPPNVNIVIPLHGQVPIHADAIAQKVTRDHITEAIKHAGEREQFANTERMLSTSLMGGVGLLAFLFVFGICWLFLSFNKPELLEKILPPLITFVTGAFGGFGFGRYSARKPKSE